MASVTINGIDFDPIPGIRYKHDYVAAMRKVAEGYTDENGKWDELSVCRALMLNDLWFLLYFGMGYKTANHPFVVKVCREIEDGPKSFTLDIWAREHFKSAILNKAETIQFVLRNPEKSTGIFSYIKPLAKKFLFEIKETFNNSSFLNKCFPDVLWGVGRAAKEAPLWALDEGIIVRRKTNMPEPTVSAWGLTEGMPIGMHFDRRVYDDISTEDMCRSIDMMEQVKTKFDSSQNIGKEGGIHRVIGTYYHHSDPLNFIRDKKDLNGNPKYHVRIKPATHDGTANGKPVLFSQAHLDELKGDRTFNFQQLCDPTPATEQKLMFEYLNPIEPKFIPRDLFRVVIVDQAGDADSNKGGDTDPWAVLVAGIEPVTDDLGQSRVFIENIWAEVAGESEAIDQIIRMYLDGGMIERVGVEKVGISSTHIHVAQALKARGRHVEFSDNGRSNGVLLRPAGRNKKKFIEGALAWPINNGKVFLSNAIPECYRERLRTEMRNFPFWHDDILNTMAYIYDILKNVQGSFAMRNVDEDDPQNQMAKVERIGVSRIGGY